MSIATAGQSMRKSGACNPIGNTLAVSHPPVAQNN